MITSNSKEVKKGDTFVAIKGGTLDGHDFIEEAIKRGSGKIYGEKSLNYPNYSKVKDSRRKLGELASEFYDNPSSKLKVIGVTGTKGKTTTCHIIHHILTSLGKKTGLMSSITSPGFHVTTPDVVSLNRDLRDMVDKGYEYAVIEVSSHGIDQGRVASIKFEVAALTNIAPEHLDYHKTFEEYKRTKLSFLRQAKVSIVGEEETDLDILPGKFNNLNAQLAVDIVSKLGFGKKDAVKALRSFKLPEGRLERIDMGQPFDVYIDFAHTPDSLEAVLTYLRSKTRGRLTSVFGCAGERDPRKRPEMGKISTQIADLSVFTVEDPRSEDIFNILKSMESGALPGKFVSISDRGEAIAFALASARKGDIVGIFGKGHEKSMSYQGFEHPWSDKEIISGLLNGKKDISAIVLAAGKGTRMKSSRPKVLREICGHPMLSYTLENLRMAGLGDMVVVVNFRKNEVMRRFGGAVKFAVQKMSKRGTADAARAGLPFVSKESGTLIVINGDDSAFYKPETIEKVIKSHAEAGAIITFVSLIKDNPFGLGRVVRDKSGNLVGIIEEKDATDAQRRIKEINSGLYLFDKKWFGENIDRVKKGPQGEYYLVDMVKRAVDSKQKVNVFQLPDDSEWQGVNTPEQLMEAEEKMKKRLGYA